MTVEAIEAPSVAADMDQEDGVPGPAARQASDETAAAAWLLAGDGGWLETGRRTAVGLGLAGLYGLALGMRDGGTALVASSLAVPAAMLAVIVVGTPALFIGLALFDVPLDGQALARLTGRGAAAMGLTLGGLAPVVALFVATEGSWLGAALAAALGLAVGGVIGLRHVQLGLREAMVQAPLDKRSLAGLSFAAFAVFATVLGCRVWLAAVPLLAFGGGS